MPSGAVHPNITEPVLQGYQFSWARWLRASAVPHIEPVDDGNRLPRLSRHLDQSRIGTHRQPRIAARNCLTDGNRANQQA